MGSMWCSALNRESYATWSQPFASSHLLLPLVSDGDLGESELTAAVFGSAASILASFGCAIASFQKGELCSTVLAYCYSFK